LFFEKTLSSLKSTNIVEKTLSEVGT